MSHDRAKKKNAFLTSKEKQTRLARRRTNSIRTSVENEYNWGE